MKKTVLVALGVIGGLSVIAGAALAAAVFFGMPADQVEESAEVPTVLAELQIVGGMRMVDSEYIVARRLYSNGVVLQKTNTEEIGIFKELTPDGLANYQAALAAYASPEELGAKRPEQYCAMWADGIDYMFSLPSVGEQGVVSSCDYELNYNHVLLSPLMDDEM